MRDKKEKPPQAATSEGFAEQSSDLQSATKPNTAANQSATIKIIHRPVITLPSRPCPNCEQSFIAAWGWLFLPSGLTLDLCGACARILRYGAAEAQRALLATLWARYRERRAA